jgi:hypothetical protein
MILQKVIKGIPGIDESHALQLMETGIVCNWWRKVNPLPQNEVPMRLTARNLDWHQNRYSDPDPDEGNEPFGQHTPFISTTAGTYERQRARLRNFLHPAFQVALEFATDSWQQDGCLFYCYVFVIGRPSIPHQVFAEEIRELNIFNAFSLFQPEGEITAKIIIPPAQIERFEFYDISTVRREVRAGRRPRPTAHARNTKFFVTMEETSNMRGLLP